jgi:hypothetical protein
MATNTDATFTHATPGCMTSSHKITIKNACKQFKDTDFEFDQPANSIVDGVFVRVVGAITIGGAADIGFRMGTNSDHTGIDIVGAVSNGILDQSDNATVAAGNVISFSIAGTGGVVLPGITNGAGSFTGVARKIFGRINTGNQAITGDNELEVHVAYRHF